MLETNEYIPNGEEQLIRVQLRISGEDLESNALAAGVRLKVTNPPGEVATGNVIGVALQALIFVFASSENSLAGSEALNASLEISNLGVIPVGQMGETGAVSPVGFIEGGQVAIAFNQSNLGNLFTFVTHRIEIRKTDWFVSQQDRDLIVFENEIEQATMLPGQVRRNEVAVVANVPGSERVVNLVEDWGIYQIDLISSSSTGLEDPVVITSSATFVVFPTRAAIAVIIFVLLIGIAIFRGAKKMVRKPRAGGRRRSKGRHS